MNLLLLADQNCRALTRGNLDGLEALLAELIRIVREAERSDSLSSPNLIK